MSVWPAGKGRWVLVIVGAVVLVVLVILAGFAFAGRGLPPTSQQAAEEFIDSLNTANVDRVSQLTCAREEKNLPVLRNPVELSKMTFTLGKVEQLSETKAIADALFWAKSQPAETRNFPMVLVKEGRGWKYCGIGPDALR